jgi:hypothetical protein
MLKSSTGSHIPGRTATPRKYRVLCDGLVVVTRPGRPTKLGRRRDSSNWGNRFIPMLPITGLTPNENNGKGSQ